MLSKNRGYKIINIFYNIFKCFFFHLMPGLQWVCPIGIKVCRKYWSLQTIAWPKPWGQSSLWASSLDWKSSKGWWEGVCTEWGLTVHSYPHPRPAAEKYKEHLALVACEQLNHLRQSVEQGFTLGKTMVPKYTTATGLPSIKGKIGHRGVWGWEERQDMGPSQVLVQEAAPTLQFHVYQKLLSFLSGIQSSTGYLL